MMRRRALLTTAAAVAAGLAAGRDASALGRTPLGGTVKLSLPWSLRSIDPHDFTDPLAALFGHAIFDTLVVHDKRGFTPSLAETLPQKEAGATMVRLRPGLRTASGKSLDARDVLASLKRARARGAAALLNPLGTPVVGKDGLTLLFTKGSSSATIVALSSPLCAIVPRDFDPRRPDGTGAFAAAIKDRTLTLTRNLSSAMGASFLESVVVREVSDLRDSARDFETGRDDVGWLATGAFAGRPEAEKMDLGTVATFVLAASSGAGPLAKPGALQKLVDEIPRGALAHLGLGTLPPGSSSAAYDGPAIDLWVEPSLHLFEIADAISGALSSAGHEITVKKGARDDIAARRSRGDALLSLHVVRPLASATLSGSAALELLDDPTKTSLSGKGSSLREAARGLRLAVVGNLRVAGGKSPEFSVVSHAHGGWDLAASFQRRKKPSP